MTSEASNCIAEQVSKSEIGTLYLDSQAINDALWMEDFVQLDTTYLDSWIAVLTEKLGLDVPLTLEVSYQKMQINYDMHDQDVIFDFILELTIRYDMEDPRNADKEDKELLYDEIPVILGLDIEIDDDILYGNINLCKLDIDPKYGQISYPIRNEMNFTTNDYVRFLYSIGYILEDMQSYFNEVDLKYGVPFPYDTKEFYTTVTFEDDVMYFLLDLGEEAYMFVDLDSEGPLPFENRDDVDDGWW